MKTRSIVFLTATVAGFVGSIAGEFGRPVTALINANYKRTHPSVEQTEPEVTIAPLQSSPKPMPFENTETDKNTTQGPSAQAVR